LGKILRGTMRRSPMRELRDAGNDLDPAALEDIEKVLTRVERA